MIRILYGLCVFGCLAGGWVLWWTFSTALSAPQEATGAALAIALAVIPYCLARAAQEMMRPGGE